MDDGGETWKTGSVLGHFRPWPLTSGAALNDVKTPDWHGPERSPTEGENHLLWVQSSIAASLEDSSLDFVRTDTPQISRT